MSAIRLTTVARATPHSPTADRAEDTARTYGLKVRHDQRTDPYDRTATRHHIHISGERSALEMIVPDLQKLGFRPVIH